MTNLKKTIICKGLTDYVINKSINRLYSPKAGDLAVFKVLELGKHISVQGLNGNNCYIFPGDLVMAAFGNRYATDQFEGYVPDQYYEEYQILGKGGAVGILASMHDKLEEKGTTNLELVGYVCSSEGEVLNSKTLKRQEEYTGSMKKKPFQTILSLGSAMDSGKTTTAAFLARGLREANKTVAYIKLTGTVYTKDRHFARDCGAHIALDFSDFGFPSTYMCDLPELLDLHQALINKASTINPDYVIIEIADGLLQRETAMLLRSKKFMSQVNHIIFSAGDSMAALSGMTHLYELDFAPFAISGLLTASPLLIKEVRENSSCPVLTLEDLANSAVQEFLLEPAIIAA